MGPTTAKDSQVKDKAEEKEKLKGEQKDLLFTSQSIKDILKT